MTTRILRRVNGLPFIRMTVGGDENSILALIDTGSERTLIDASVVSDDIEGKEDMVKWRGAFGVTESPMIECQLPIGIAGRNETMDVIVTDLSSMTDGLRKRTATGRGDVKAIIGADALAIFEAKVNMKSGKLTIADKVCKVEPYGDGGKMYSVGLTVTHDVDVTLRAKSCADAAWRAVHGIDVGDLHVEPFDVDMEDVDVEPTPTIAIRERTARLIK